MLYWSLIKFLYIFLSFRFLINQIFLFIIILEHSFNKKKNFNLKKFLKLKI